ncbi:MAG: hypothetical protein QME94_03350 [Anaerolineae bacterium]|nr:hypothetical protein [Anaerolineae bacterium]
MAKRQHASDHGSGGRGRRGEPAPTRAPSPQTEASYGDLAVLPGTAKAGASGYSSALGGGRLAGAQRLSVASQVAQALGNAQLQRLVAITSGASAAQPAVQAKNGEKTAPKAPIELLREELGDVFVDERACLGYIAQLGPQVATVRNDKWMMGRMAAAFNAAEMLQAVRQLALELKWAVYWIDQAREAGAVGAKGYDSLVQLATANQIAQLIGWRETFDVVRTNRGGNPLTAFPPLNANDPLLAWVFATYGHYVDWILADATALQLLHFVLGHNPKAMLGGLDKSGRWTPFVSKLPKGTALAAVDKAAIQTLATSTSDARLQSDLFEVRFDVETGKAGAIPWESKGLMRAWQLLSILPVSDVEGNPNLEYFLRAGAGGTRGASDMSQYVRYWYEASKLGQVDVKAYTDPTDPMHNMNIFDTTIIHEIGHTVDGAHNFSKSYCPTVPGGGWEWHSYESAVDAMVAASPWKINLPKAAAPKAAPGKSKTWTEWIRAGIEWLTETSIEENARRACIQAMTRRTSVRTQANAIDSSGNLWKAIKDQPVVRAIPPAFEEQQPWMNHGKQIKFGSRYYHEGYKHTHQWVSYLSSRYDAKLSKYQFRDPTDWFAEVYACYYGTVKPSAPKSEDAGTKVPEPIRTWFRTNVARVVPPPGAGKAGP